MKAVILAAGMGIRLRPMTEHYPKGLIEIDGRTLLECSLDALKEIGINDVIIVTGFYSSSIKKKFDGEYNGTKLKYIENDMYSTTGSMYSFSKAKKLINEDILLLESDLLYDKNALKTLLNSEFRDVILVAELLNSGDDVYICTNERNEITNLGKKIPEEDKKQVLGALVGISKYSKRFLPKLFKKAEQEFANNELNYHYEETVFATSKLGNPIYAELCKGLNWIEIDNENDLKRAKEDIYFKIKGSNNGAN
ncbi:MAG: phosphocholine cytidylyltransferase family protein [Nanoarchaeota archaeon]|nr:phosphocholine cytidylyltransferase family protein [Nanoarchaeota archaeon]